MAGVHNKLFVVDITRTETYIHTVRVKAKDEAEARRKVMNFDDDDGFVNEWNELDPSVNTEYEATEAIDTNFDDQELKDLPEVK